MGIGPMGAGAPFLDRSGVLFTEIKPAKPRFKLRPTKQCRLNHKKCAPPVRSRPRFCDDSAFFRASGARHFVTK